MRCRGGYGAELALLAEVADDVHGLGSRDTAVELGATRCDEALEVVELGLGASGDEIVHGGLGGTIHGRTPSVVD